MNLSVIIPCRKEAKNIEPCIKRVAHACPNAEILIVDSGLDDTKNIVDQLKTTIPNLHYFLSKPDRGKGDAIRQGISLATQPFIAQIDADLQFHPEELPFLMEPLILNKADMVLGSRFLKKSLRKPGSSPFFRSLGNRIISFLCSLLLWKKITDALAGIKMWKREVTDSFKLKSYTYSYEAELFIKALKKKWRVVDVPVTFEPRTEGVSTVSVFRAGMIIIKDIFRFCFQK